MKFLFRQGLRRGLLGDSRPWLVVFMITGALRLLGRLAGRQEKVVFREELREGTSIVITHGTEREPVISPAP